MTRITAIALIFVLLTLSLAGCDEGLPINVYERVDVPVVLVFPSGEMRDQLETDFVEHVERTNELWENAGVTLVIEEVSVENYDTYFDVRFDLDAMFDITPIGPLKLYALESVVNGDGDPRGGYAAYDPENPCRKLTVFRDAEIAWQEPLLVAHEAGHHLDLTHVEDPKNFMHEEVQGKEITPEQEADLLYSANYYRQVCLGLER